MAVGVESTSDVVCFSVIQTICHTVTAKLIFGDHLFVTKNVNTMKKYLFLQHFFSFDIDVHVVTKMFLHPECDWTCHAPAVCLDRRLKSDTDEHRASFYLFQT